ncbi:hypothetical protein F2Q69_00057907 [Brassica cretica]|uniref:Uncharacterized protein n=1 Tax=Brassica cretica TaxID=69181 RepID=A0A8S9ND22_BRACR|nr:hypothetical protein F2Q69_00057907 [Brassica cretica]
MLGRRRRSVEFTQGFVEGLEELPVVKEVELKKGGKISVEKDSSKEAVREMADEKDFGQGESKNQDDETVL